MSEEWRPVKDFEHVYEVSSYGRIRSVDHVVMRKDGKPLHVKGCVLKALPNNRGYPRVSLCFSGHSTWSHVHTLIAEAFLSQPKSKIGPLADQYGVNHKDGDKTNNHINNLEYITNRANVRHARKNGLLDVAGMKNGRAKISADDVREIRRLYTNGMRQIDLARQFSIDQTQISRIVRHVCWPHIKN